MTRKVLALICRAVKVSSGTAIAAASEVSLNSEIRLLLTASALYLATAYLIAILLRMVERRYASIR